MPDFDLFIANRTVASMEGQQVSFSDDDLRGIAERYDPSLHEAPLIVGHPKHDAPAFGWVKGLSFADGRLQAFEHQVDSAFSKLRSSGAYKKLSARFFAPDSPNNPTPGQYYLRDVGFLGALTPAVKGLRTYSFGDATEPVLTCELSFGDVPEPSSSAITRLLGLLRNWLMTESGTDTAERAQPAHELETLREVSPRTAELAPSVEPATAPDLRSIANTAANPQEPSPMTDAEKAELQAARQKASDLEAENNRLKAQQAQAANALRHAEHASFSDALIEQGRWPSGHRDMLIATLDHLSEPVDGTGCISFGDGDAAEPLHQALRKGLQSLPTLVSFGDVATKAKAEGGSKAMSDREVADAARAWKTSEEKAGRHVSFADAVKHITKNSANTTAQAEKEQAA